MAESRRFGGFRRVVEWIACYCWLVISPAISVASDVTLAWDLSPDPQISGYRVYYGPATGSYTNFVEVGLTNAATITGLVPGSTYFFAATSFIDLGLESPYSDETSYLVPAPNQPPTLAPISDITINQNAGQTTVLLSGITCGEANENQPLTVTATSSNPSVIPAPTVNYASPSTVGSLTFAPVRNATGTARIKVVVNDGQSTNNLAIQTFTVTIVQFTPGVVPLANACIRPQALFNFVVLPPNNHRLTFSLEPQSPAGASVDSLNGVFTWCPSLAQASSTNTVLVRITDNDDPTQTVIGSLVLIVQDALSVTMAGTNVMAGQNVQLPVCVRSSEGLTSLAFSLSWAPDRFLNPALTLTSPGLGQSMLKNQGTNLLVLIQAAPGRLLQGPNLIGQLTFQTVAGQQSAFVDLHIAAIGATKADASAFANYFVQAGEVAVVGTAPLLRASLSGAGSRTLTVYGAIGANYQLQYATNLFPKPTWYSGPSFTQSVSAQTLSVSPPAPTVFYRLLRTTGP